MIYEIQCKFCHQIYEIEISDDEFRRLDSGEYVQDVFPFMSLDIRELLISGVCGECFDEITKEY